MQAQHIITLVGLAACFLLLTVFIRRAIKRALRRSYWAGKSAGIADSSARMDALNADIAMLARRRERDRKGFLHTIELKNLAIRQLEEQSNSGSTGSLSSAGEPAPTITTKDRLALVTVMVKGTPYVIVDICLRMLKPSELYKAQGFPADYVITHGADGKPFTKTQQVHMCGDSVSPPPMAAMARANDPWRQSQRIREAA